MIVPDVFHQQLTGRGGRRGGGGGRRSHVQRQRQHETSLRGAIVVTAILRSVTKDRLELTCDGCVECRALFDDGLVAKVIRDLVHLSNHGQEGEGGGEGRARLWSLSSPHLDWWWAPVTVRSVHLLQSLRRLSLNISEVSNHAVEMELGRRVVIRNFPKDMI